MGLTGRTKDSVPPNPNSRDELIISLSGTDSIDYGTDRKNERLGLAPNPNSRLER